jgi:hypothetical protein
VKIELSLRAPTEGGGDVESAIGAADTAAIGAMEADTAVALGLVA